MNKRQVKSMKDHMWNTGEYGAIGEPIMSGTKQLILKGEASSSSVPPSAQRFTVYYKGKDPKKCFELVVRKLVDNHSDRLESFRCFVRTSVNLEARNTSNFKEKDLALLQVIDLADKVGVDVV